MGGIFPLYFEHHLIFKDNKNKVSRASTSVSLPLVPANIDRMASFYTYFIRLVNFFLSEDGTYLVPAHH